jgi:hypothetical protein
MIFEQIQICNEELKDLNYSTGTERISELQKRKWDISVCNEQCALILAAKACGKMKITAKLEYITYIQLIKYHEYTVRFLV